jgi:hypothetical protein
MRYLKTYNIFESMVDKKIELLEDLVIELEDTGLTIEIWKENKSIVMLISDDSDVSKLSDDNYYDSNLYDSQIILDFELRLKSHGMNYRTKYGGGDKVYYEFDKWSKMTDLSYLKLSGII